MPTVRHAFESAVTDLGDADDVGPDEWNADHVVTGPFDTDLIALATYGPTTQANYSTSSTTIDDIDATNARITFIVPASGRVLVYLEVPAAHLQGWMELGLREGTTVIAAARINTDDAGGGAAFRTFLITGLTPGASKTYKAGFSVGSGGSGTANVYAATDAPGTYPGGIGPIIMSVRDAQPSSSGSVTSRSVLLGLPTGILSRQYTFDSTIEGWTVDGGTLTATGGKLQHVGSASNQTALEPSSATSLTDGEVEMDVTSVSGTEFGVVFRATDADNHWMLAIRSAGAGAQSSVQLYKKVAGVYTAYASTGSSNVGTEGGLVSGSSSELTVRVLLRFAGQTLAVYVDGSHVFTTILDGTNTSGRIGTRTSSGFTLQVDNVRVFTGYNLTAGNLVAAEGTSAPDAVLAIGRVAAYANWR